MKFKKAFAWILAVAMVITLMPSMAFASTSNASITSPAVSADSTIDSNAVISLKNTSGVPITDGTIRITLENATFSDGTVSLGDSGQSLDSYVRMTSDSAITTNWNGITGTKKIDVTADSVSDTSATLTFQNTNIPDQEYLYLVLNGSAVYAGSENGPVTLTIDGRDSRITGGTYTIGTVGSGRTITEVTGKIATVPRGEIASSARIEITETAINSIPTDVAVEVIKMTLPKDCVWQGASISGSMVTKSNPDPVGVNTSATPPVPVPTFGTTRPAGLNTNYLYVDPDNSRIAYLVLNTNGLGTNKRDNLVIAPKYSIGRDTPEGDITVDIEGYRAYDTSGNSSTRTIMDASDLIINVYGQENVEVSTVAEENLPTIISGKLQNNREKDFTVKVTLKENMKQALQGGRYVDFKFPEEVQVKSGIKYVISKNTSANTNPINMNFIDMDTPIQNDTSSFSFLVPETGNILGVWDPTKANTITLEIPVTVEAGYEGDITCTVSGAKAGVNETSLVVGKALPPISITANTTEIRTGVQTQAVADITITENVAGYLSDKKSSNDFEIGIDSLGLASGMSIAKFDKVEVTSGNLEIGKAIKDTGSRIKAIGSNNFINIPIQSSSSTASTIVISGVQVNLNRTLPEGGYSLLAGGIAIEDNKAYNDDGFSDVAAKMEKYVTIVTPADPTTSSGQLINAVFTLRQDTFINNGETVQMDTAPYLDANNRTQLPIRYAAIACGVPESDISWNQATQTATINAGSKVLRITIGSNIMQTSEGNVVMDTAAVSSNGRIFVPIRYIANALGANVAWDQDAKTITLTN